MAEKVKKGISTIKKVGNITVPVELESGVLRLRMNLASGTFGKKEEEFDISLDIDGRAFFFEFGKGTYAINVGDILEQILELRKKRKVKNDED